MELFISAIYILCDRNSPLLENDNITKDLINIINPLTTPFTQEFITLNKINGSTYQELAFSFGMITAIALQPSI